MENLKMKMKIDLNGGILDFEGLSPIRSPF